MTNLSDTTSMNIASYLLGLQPPFNCFQPTACGQSFTAFPHKIEGRCRQDDHGQWEPFQLSIQPREDEETHHSSNDYIQKANKGSDPQEQRMTLTLNHCESLFEELPLRLSLITGGKQHLKRNPGIWWTNWCSDPASPGYEIMKSSKNWDKPIECCRSSAVNNKSFA